MPGCHSLPSHMSRKPDDRLSYFHTSKGQGGHLGWLWGLLPRHSQAGFQRSGEMHKVGPLPSPSSGPAQSPDLAAPAHKLLAEVVACGVQLETG